MSRRTSLIITFSVLVVVVVAYVIVRNLPEKPYEPPERERYTHLNVPSSDIVYMDFDRGPGDRLTFRRVEHEVDGETKTDWEVLRPELSFEPETSAVTDIAFTMSNLFSQHLVEEEPEDLTIYGLDPPRGRVTVRTKDDTEVVINIGELTPTGVTYYVQPAGKDVVYTMRKYTVDKVFSDVDILREDTFPVPDRQAFTYLRIENERRIVVRPVNETDDVQLGVPGSYMVVEPYRRPRIIDAQKFQEMMQTIPATFTISEFVSDDPEDLSAYGLDDPRYVFEIHDEGSSLHLLFGDEADEDTAYVKHADQPQVFTLPISAVQFLQTDPFEIIDKFMLIVNIKYVDSFTISNSTTSHTARIDWSDYNEEKDEGAVYLLDGIEIEEKPFKQFYQAVIGLLADAENPSPEPLEQPDVTVEFQLNDKVEVDSARLDLVQVDKNFYAAYRDGITEFLVSDYQVEGMFESAETLLEAATE